MIRPTREQIVMFHADTIWFYGRLDGVREEKALDSAINAPFQTFDDEELFDLSIAKVTFSFGNLVYNI